MHSIGAPRAVLRVEALKLPLDRLHRLSVEQLAELGVAEQIAQLRLIDGERLRAPLGQGRVAVVEKTGDIGEEERRGERRRLLGIDGGDANLAASHVGQRADESRHVEEVAQALPIGFEQDRERSVPRRHGEEVRRPLALLPQRRAHAGTALRQQQRSRRVLAELCGEERRRAELPHHERLDFVRIGQQEPRFRRHVDIGKADHEAVVSPQGFDFDPGFLANLCRRRHRPRRMNASAPRREHADPPVAELVADALDDD